VPARLAYVTIVVDTNIWVRDIRETAGQAHELIASTRGDADPQFSPDGRRIAFASERSGTRQIWTAKSDGSSPVQLTSFPSGYTNAPRWSPDGTRLVFSSIQNDNRDLYTISPDGGPLRRLTSVPSEEGRPSWSRNGRWVYCYSNRSGTQEVWKVPADGGEMLQVTTGGGHESFESPDGKLLYYEDYGVKGLHSVSTDSTQPQNGTVVLPSVRPGYWAVAERGIYFVKFDEHVAAPGRFGSRFWIRTPDDDSTVSHSIKFYDFRTRKVTQMGTIERRLPPFLPGFSVTHDGSRVAWSQIDHAESDLMMIENFR
jgi:dipeptidyl aminopeptidase/acylaminoacyl peptidase